MTCNNVRGRPLYIAVSSVLSKIFEKCMLERFEYFLLIKDNQYGIEKVHVHIVL